MKQLGGSTPGGAPPMGDFLSPTRPAMDAPDPPQNPSVSPQAGPAQSPSGTTPLDGLFPSTLGEKDKTRYPSGGLSDIG